MLKGIKYRLINMIKKSLLNFNPSLSNSSIDLYNDINSNNQNKSHL